MLITEISKPIFAEADKPDEPVTFSWGRFFADSFIEMKKTYPDLDNKYYAFMDRKSQSIQNKYGTHDYPLAGNLAGFRHCHLMMDALLIYRIQRRNIEMLFVCDHDAIKPRNAASLIRKIS